MKFINLVLALMLIWCLVGYAEAVAALNVEKRSLPDVYDVRELDNYCLGDWYPRWKYEPRYEH